VKIARKRKKRGAVVFDFMGVVFREGMVLTNLLIPMFRPPLPMAEIRERYQRFVLGEIVSEQFWLGIAPDYRRAQEAYLNCFDLSDGFEVVYDLRDRYILAVLSEIPVEWGDYLVSKFHLDRIFDVMVLSGQVGVTKPDTRIFQILMERLGNDRPYHFIDDNQTNLMVASSLGWKTIWMRNRISEFCCPGFEPDVSIETLPELRQLLIESTGRLARG